MALKHHGLDGYAEAITRDIELAEHFAEEIRQSSDLELMAPASLSIVCFRSPLPRCGMMMRGSIF